MTAQQIPSLGFARGSVVRAKGGGPNMLVTRQLGCETAVVLLEGSQDTKLTMRTYKTADLVQELPTHQDQTMTIKPVWQAPRAGEGK